MAGSYDRTVRIFNFNGGHSREVRPSVCPALHPLNESLNVWAGVHAPVPLIPTPPAATAGLICCTALLVLPQVYFTKRMQRVFAVRFSGDGSYVFSGQCPPADQALAPCAALPAFSPMPHATVV